jgi:hypothetical protein
MAEKSFKEDSHPSTGSADLVTDSGEKIRDRRLDGDSIIIRDPHSKGNLLNRFQMSQLVKKIESLSDVEEEEFGRAAARLSDSDKWCNYWNIDKSDPKGREYLFACAYISHFSGKCFPWDFNSFP